MWTHTGVQIHYATQAEVDAYLAERGAQCAIADPYPVYVVGQWVDGCSVLLSWIHPEYLGWLMDADKTYACVIAPVADPKDGRYDVDHIIALQSGDVGHQSNIYRVTRLRVMVRGEHWDQLYWHCNCFDAWRIQQECLDLPACGHALLVWALAKQEHAETLRKLYALTHATR